MCDAVAAVNAPTVRADRVEMVRGRALVGLGRFDDAIAADLAAANGALGSALGRAGHPEDGATALRRALAVEEPVLGPNHPEVARTLHDLAELERVLGAPTATPDFQRARAIFAAAHGTDTLEVADLDASLANAALDHLDLDGAERFATQARAELARSGIDEPAEVSTIETVLGNIEQDRDRCAAAIPHYERALDGSHRAGQTGRELAVASTNLAGCLADVGRHADARAPIERALAAWEVAGAPPERAQALAILADVEAHAGNRKRAVEIANDALAIIAKEDGGPFGPLRDYLHDQLAKWGTR